MKKLLLILFVFLSFNALHAQVTATYVLTAPSCSSATVLTINASGGSAPYQYSLDSGSFITSNVLTVSFGSHSVVVMDALGATFNFDFTAAEPVPPAISINAVAGVMCAGMNNGSLMVTVLGGVPPFSFSINGTPYVTGSSNTHLFAGLAAGTQLVSVQDANTCVTQNTVVISQPAPIIASVVLDASQTTATITATGGVPPYEYSINGTEFLPTNVFTNLVPGNYNFITQDVNGCMFMSIMTINPVPLQLVATNAYVDYNTDGFTNVGDVIHYQFTVSNIGNLPVTDITLSQFGLNTVGGPIALLAPGTSDATTFTATHTINQTDINNGVVSFDVMASGTYNGNTVTDVETPTRTLGISDGIRLNAFIDANNNGIKDGAEQNFALGNFHYELNDNGTVHNITSPTGTHYIYENNPANSFDVSFTVNADYTAQYNVTTAAYNNISVASGSGITTYNFPVTALGYKDLVVAVLPFGAPPRPGFTYINRLTYSNNGNETIAAGTLTFTKNSAVAITSISSGGATNTATGFTYNFTNLTPGEVRTFFITMQVPTIPTVALGDILTNSASGTLAVGVDANFLNNTNTLSQVVIGSYDPNDKTESHGGKIVHSAFTANDYLTYTIQFENTGTANAVNVRVNDVLDAKLDETTVKMINASHSYTLDRVGNNLNWNFNAIELPPSVANTTTGKGYISFQVKPKAGFAIGDIIPNEASIFFDFNPAIVTNTSTTEFVASLGTPEFENTVFKMYPNPTKNILTIALQNNAEVIDSVLVNDITGKTVKMQKPGKANVTLDLSDLSRGIYFVKVQSQRQEKVLKVVKE